MPRRPRYLICDLLSRRVLYAIPVSASSATPAGTAMVHLDRDHCDHVPDCCVRVLFLRSLTFMASSIHASAADERAFASISVNQRSAKPRRIGITEIRGPYYAPMGPRYLEDI